MKHKKRVVIFTVIFGLILILATICYIKINKLDLRGWVQFKRGAIKNYSYLKNVDIDRGLRTSLQFRYNLMKKPTEDEIEELFNYTINYISKEDQFEALVKYQKGKRKYPFYNLDIAISFLDNGEMQQIRIQSEQSESGEPKLEYYKKWRIRNSDYEKKEITIQY